MPLRLVSAPLRRHVASKHSLLGCALALALFACLPASAAEQSVWLTQLDLQHLHYSGWSKPQIDTPAGAKPLAIAGRAFEHSVGVTPTSSLWLELDGRVTRFQASVGIDDAAAGEQPSAVTFLVIGDGRVLWRSPVCKRGDAAQPVDLGLEGVRLLLLKIERVRDGGTRTLADWAGARFEFAGEKPRTVNAPPEEAVILTPKPPAEPRINGPKVYGCRPGHPFLYRIPATGERPMRFSAAGLPAGLRLDPATGIIDGTAPERGTHVVTLRAENARGANERVLKIVSGDTLALTPHMGWNHWYAHYGRVTDALVRQAADLMVANGMADVGYSYVNIDDCWGYAPDAANRRLDPQRVGPGRDAAGNLRPNVYFPDMPALTAYIHAKGLKTGIYTSPGPLTCGGFAASHGHEEQDARQFAAWGFDFLKYDWCSYKEIANGDLGLPMLQKPYRLMGKILREQPRDMVFNLCQYGRGDVWTWGAEVGGQSWRTAGDLGADLQSFMDVALRNASHGRGSKPGEWNDPDYLQIGRVGDARSEGETQPCPLTPTEQYSFVSLWSLMAAPLIYSGDMASLDAFTLNVLCNPEVIEIDQDPLGECARVVTLTPDTFLMIKRLEDGGQAIGLGNRGEIAAEITALWKDVGVTGPQAVRDVWRQRDLGAFAAEFKVTVPRHGVVLLRLKPATP